MKKKHNKGDLGTAKEEKRNDFVSKIGLLNSLDWEIGYRLIHDFCYSDIKLNLKEIKEILLLQDKDFIDLFLSAYILFDDADKAYLELFIDESLSNTNTEFVSDLIYFANDLALNIKYKSVLEIIKKHSKDENYLVLASIIYISNNVKYHYIEEIVEALELVVNSPDYFQSEQILASLTLYKITNKSTYLDFISELLEFDRTNLTFTVNVLNETMYQSKYFALENILEKIPAIRDFLNDDK